MHGANITSESGNQLPDLDTLDIAALKALVLAKQSELESRRTEIENGRVRSNAHVKVRLLPLCIMSQ